MLRAPDPFVDAARQERNAALYRNLQKLPQQYRVVLQLHYIEDFKVEYICEILKKSPKQVYNLLSRARVSLKELLIKEGITYEEL